MHTCTHSGGYMVIESNWTMDTIGSVGLVRGDKIRYDLQTQHDTKLVGYG